MRANTGVGERGRGEECRKEGKGVGCCAEDEVECGGAGEEAVALISFQWVSIGER